MSEKKDKPENIRPNIKDFFGESATLQQVHETYLSQPQLFKYAQALDNYIDQLQETIATANATIQHQKYLIEELEKDKVALKNEIARIVNLSEQPGGYHP